MVASSGRCGVVVFDEWSSGEGFEEAAGDGGGYGLDVGEGGFDL